MLNYRLFESEGKGNVVVFAPNHPSVILQADSFHPHWPAIKEGLERGDERVIDLFDVRTGMGRRLQMLSERVSYNGQDILFDGNVIHSVLANQIQRAVESGEADWKPLVAFWEKLESNPLEHSKQQAYRWLSTHDFKITESGDVVAYKGVRNVGLDQYSSISSSSLPDAPSAYVDGVPVPPLSVVRQTIGSVVTMPREEVKHDPAVACHRGLHVGDWSYASSFAKGAVLEVHVNPRDIVSVPSDSSSRKVRTCRYQVVGVVNAQYQGGPILRPATVKESWQGDVGYIPQS